MRKIKGFLKDNKYIFIAFIVPVLLVVLAFIVNGIYPFGDGQIAVIDMYHQYLPFLGELQNKLQEGGSLFYTWNGAAGSNFWNLIAYYGASPLNLILALFPKSLIMEAVTIVLLIKIGLAGSFMALFLRYTSEKCDGVTLAFSTLYALCSFVLAYYWCIMWMDAVALLPLCILGLNKIIDGKGAYLYAISLAIVIFSNYYMAIMVCIFIAFYYPILYFLKVRKGGAKKCLITTSRAVGYSVIAVAMAAVMLLPTYISMQSTYYISSEMPDNWIFYNDALDVINQLLPYTELTFREGLPNLYSGLIVVIMLVLYVVNEAISTREKLLNGLFLVFMFMSLNTNKLDFLWHGLHFPNQLPYRYTFVISFVLIGIAYRTFEKREYFKLNHLWAILFAGTAYYVVAQKIIENKEYSMQLFFYGGVAWLVLFSIVLILDNKKIIDKKYTTFLIAMLIILEMSSASCTSFEKVGNSYREGYFANSKDIAKMVEIADEEFVRMEMDYLYTLNGPALYHYKGISQFSSSINASTTYLMEKIGFDGSPGRNRFNYNQTTPVNNALMGIKYIIAKNEELEDRDFKQVAKAGYTRLYESKYPLSIGYMTGNEIRTWNTDSDNPFTVLNDYIRAATGNRYDDVFNNVQSTGYRATNGDVKPIGDGEFQVRTDSKDSNARVRLEYTSDKTQKYYVFIETPEAKSIIASNGNKLKDIEIRNDCGSIVNIGTIKKGKKFTINVNYEKGKAGNIVCHVRTLDYDVWNSAYDIISSNELKITDSGDRFVKGSIDVKKSGVMVTSIPYDKGWSLKVDGKKQDINELTGGVFISCPLDVGQHEILLEFTPPGILLGLIISILSILILIGAPLLTRILIKRRTNKEDLAMNAISLQATSSEQECLQEEDDCNRA